MGEEGRELTEERWGEPGCERNGAGDHVSDDERRSSGMSRGPRWESGGDGSLNSSFLYFSLLYARPLDATPATLVCFQL